MVNFKVTALAMGVGAVGAVIAAPVVLGVAGFTSAGIAAGSLAAEMMSAAAVANGGGVAAGSLVAVLQSAGAAGLSGTATVAVASVGAAVGAVVGAVGEAVGEAVGSAVSYTASMMSAAGGYGNIMSVETTGASARTSQQDRLEYSGEKASQTMAKTDAGRMENYKSKINRVGAKYGIEPALIAAIISRESRAGHTLQNGWGDYNKQRGAYNAWGLMQVDVNPNGGGHTAKGAWDSEEHLCQGTEILVHFIKRICNKFPGWSAEQQLKGGIAAYNMGDGNVHSYENVDAHTTGGDYSNDVVARAQWYKYNVFK